MLSTVIQKTLMYFQRLDLFCFRIFFEQVGTIYSFLFLFKVNEIGDEAEKMCRDNRRVVSRLVQWIFLLLLSKTDISFL